MRRDRLVDGPDEIALVVASIAKYDPSEPRDERGRWTDGGGTSASALFDQNDAHATVEHILGRFPADTAQKLKDAQARVDAGVSTDAPVEKGGFRRTDGTYTEERQQLHEDILHRIFTESAVRAATPAAGEQPTIIFLGGRGGSGKSWFTSSAGPVDAKSAIYLNSDDIKAMLPGYQGWNAAWYHEESTDILNQADGIARQLGVNVIYDATLKSYNGAATRLAEFEAAGYRAEGYYMFTSPQEAAGRAVNRFLKGGVNGRYVPIEVVLGSRTNERTFDAMKPSFERWAIYDNNGSHGPLLVAHGGKQ